MLFIINLRDEKIYYHSNLEQCNEWSKCMVFTLIHIYICMHICICTYIVYVYVCVWKSILCDTLRNNLTMQTNSSLSTSLFCNHYHSCWSTYYETLIYKNSSESHAFWASRLDALQVDPIGNPSDNINVWRRECHLLTTEDDLLIFRWPPPDLSLSHFLISLLVAIPSNPFPWSNSSHHNPSHIFVGLLYGH